MAEISWTAEAERWLRDIYDYIAQDNPESEEAVRKAVVVERATAHTFRHPFAAQLSVRVILLETKDLGPIVGGSSIPHTCGPKVL
jgi:hypothetical protein